MSEPTTDNVLVLGGDTGTGGTGTGNAYLGGPTGGFLGPQRPPEFRLELRNGKGGLLGFDSLVSLSCKRRHTALSNFSVVVPTREADLTDWLLSDVRLTFGDTILFRGRLDTIDGSLFAPTVTLSGSGIGVALQRGDYTMSWRNSTYWGAIDEVWTQRSEFSASVIQPDDPNHPANTQVNPSEDYSGTPMGILQSLHEEAGMRFSILHSKAGKNAVSYPQGAIRRNHDWDVLDGSRQASAEGYANRVAVTGALKRDGSGERIFAEARAEAEIDAMAKRGIGDEGVVTYPIRDESIGGSPQQRDDGISLAEYYHSAENKANAKAKSKLTDLVAKDDVGGQLEVWPTVATPGYEYYIERFTGEDPRAYGEGPYGGGSYGGPEGSWSSLEAVNYSVSRGDRSCSLDFSESEGLAETIRDVK